MNTLLINPLSCHGICQERAWDTWELMSGFNKRAWLVVNSAANPDKRWEGVPTNSATYTCVSLLWQVTAEGEEGLVGGPHNCLTRNCNIQQASERAMEIFPRKTKCEMWYFYFPFSLLGFCFFIVCRLWGVIKGANRARVALVILAIGFELSDIGCENVVTKTALAEWLSASGYKRGYHKSCKFT